MAFLFNLLRRPSLKSLKNVLHVVHVFLDFVSVVVVLESFNETLLSSNEVVAFVYKMVQLLTLF